MMTNTQIDTSGTVTLPSGLPVKWNMGSSASSPTHAFLNPFMQGYIKPALSDFRDTVLDRDTREGMEAGGWKMAFSDLAPETLARFMEDCGRVCRDLPTTYATYFGLAPCPSDRMKSGRTFWEDRQNGVRKTFPPLHLYLADDGLIRIKDPA